MAAVYYTVIFVGIGWLCIHYGWLSPYLIGTFIHMFIVSIRTTLIPLHPESMTWNWSDIHRVTALGAALCFVWLFVQVRRGKL